MSTSCHRSQPLIKLAAHLWQFYNNQTWQQHRTETDKNTNKTDRNSNNRDWHRHGHWTSLVVITNQHQNTHTTRAIYITNCYWKYLLTVIKFSAYSWTTFTYINSVHRSAASRTATDRQMIVTLYILGGGGQWVDDSALNWNWLKNKTNNEQCTTETVTMNIMRMILSVLH